MLNPFPQLLVYGFFAPLLLRATVACVLFFVAWHVHQKASILASITFPLVGKTRPWLMRLAASATALAGATLLAGYATQWSAILGILVALKLVWLKKELEPALKLPTSTYLLVLVICLSLLVTGAGALAFDLPL